MLVLNYAGAADTGGQGILIKWAFDKHSDWQYRTVCGKSNYINYPMDLPPDRGAAWWKKADVVHINNTFRAARNMPQKPMVIHHHGTIFRRRTEALLREQRRRNAQGIAATLDLWLLAPDQLHWVGAPYDREWLESFRDPVDDGVLRIGHAPTHRPIKSTDTFLKAAERLSKDIRLEVVLAERKSWTDCLALKGTVDVFFDQVLLGYGNNTIEAWGMGIPVIAGGAPDTLAEMRNRFGELPFYEATEDTIYESLRAFADPAVRAEYSHRGSEHFERFHADHIVVSQLEAIYRDA